jgi:hypothetical protein
MLLAVIRLWFTTGETLTGPPIKTFGGNSFKPDLAAEFNAPLLAAATKSSPTGG